MRRIALTIALTAALAPAAHAQVPQIDAETRGCDPIDRFACLLPFPNDFFTRPDASSATGKRLNLPLTGMPRNVAGKPIDPTDWNRSDGFSPGSMIVARVPGLDTPDAFRNTGAVPITDMARTYDPDQPVVVIDAETLERHLIWSEIDSNPADRENVTFIVRPGVNFREGRRYIVALRNLRDENGDEIEARPDFAAFRDGEATGPRAAQMEDIFNRLGQAGIDRDELYLAWDFTVGTAGSIAGRMLHIRDRSFETLGDANLADLTVQGAAPKFRVSSVTDFTPAQDSRIARRIEGTFDVPCWLSGGADCRPGNRFLIGADGLPQRHVPGTLEANFRCQIPHTTIEGPGVRPARPSLYGHGLFGSVNEMNQGQLKAMGQEHNFVFCATDWDGMSSEDVNPSLGLVIPDLSNFPMLADRVQQGMLNQLFLGRLMIHADGLSSHDAFRDEGQAVIDRSRLFYDGNSQGGIIGGALAAVAPDYERAVLGVPGMNYSTLLQRSKDFVATPARQVAMESPDRLRRAIEQQSERPITEGVGFSTFVYEAYPDESTRQVLFALLQILWDRAEANGYAQHMTSDPLPNTPPHEVMLHVGFGDHQVADVSAEVEARTIGAHVLRREMLRPGRHTSVEPFYAIDEMPSFPFAGSALVVWDTGPTRVVNGKVVGTDPSPTTNTRPTVGQDPHEYPRRQPAAREQKSAFLSIGGRVIDTCGGSYCDADPTL